VKTTVSAKIRYNSARRRIRGVKSKTDEATMLAANVILEEALRRVRVGKTKALRDGLAIRVISAEGDKLRVAIGVWGVREALFIEAGTRRQKARPYLRPGATLGRKTLKAAAEAGVRSEASTNG
jgi:hypothetical protein